LTVGHRGRLVAPASLTGTRELFRRAAFIAGHGGLARDNLISGVSFRAKVSTVLRNTGQEYAGMVRYRFQISAMHLDWPRQCACCCGPADTLFRATATRTTGQRVVHTTSQWCDVPHCSQCVNHIRISKAAKYTALAGVFLALLVGFFALAEAEAEFGWLLGIAAAGVLVGSIVLSTKIKEYARSLTRESCGSLGVAVEYIRWYGTFHEFVFSSQSYLSAFLYLNGNKRRSDIRQVY